MEVYIGDINFNLLKGFSLSNLELKHHKPSLQSTITIKKISSASGLWFQNSKKTYRDLNWNITEPHIHITNTQTQQSRTTSKPIPTISPISNNWLHNKVVTLHPRLAPVLQPLISQLAEHIHTQNWSIKRGTVTLDYFSPILNQNILKTWSKIQGKIHWKKQDKAFEWLFKGIQNKERFHLTGQQDSSNKKDFFFHYIQGLLNIKTDTSWISPQIQLKSLIGSVGSIKFYSRGTLNPLSGDMNLSNIINTNLSQISELPTNSLKGDLDLYLSFKGNINYQHSFKVTGSVNSRQLQWNTLELKDLTGDFQYQDELWVVPALGFQFKDGGQFHMSSYIDRYETKQTVHWRSTMQDVPISLFNKLVKNPKELPFKLLANLQLSGQFPLQNLHNLQATGKAHASNVRIKDNSPLWRDFSRYTQIPLDQLSTNTLNIDFRIDSQAIHVKNLQLYNNTLKIESQGILQRDHQIFFKVLTEHVVPTKHSTTKEKVIIPLKKQSHQLELRGTLARPHIQKMLIPPNIHPSP